VALNGTISEAEISELIDEWPEVAAVLPHPEVQVVHAERIISNSPVLLMGGGSDTFSATATTTCRRLTTTYNYRSMLSRAVIYKFEKAASRCFTGSRVTSIYDRTQRIYGVQYGVDPIPAKDYLEDWTTGINTSRAESYMQRKVRHYAAGVTIGYSHPWAKMVFTGSGGYSVTKGH
jgi:hypothetical protein